MFVDVVVVEVKDLDSAAEADWAAKSIWMTRQQQQEVRKDLIIFIANSKWTNMKSCYMIIQSLVDCHDSLLTQQPDELLHAW